MLESDPRTGQQTKSVLVPGTMVVNASSRVPLESERIAWICAEQLWLHRELLMKAGFFEIGRSPAISAVSPAGSIIMNDGADEWYATSVTCPFQFYPDVANHATWRERHSGDSTRAAHAAPGRRTSSTSVPVAMADPSRREAPTSRTACRPTRRRPSRRRRATSTAWTPNAGTHPLATRLLVQPHPLNPCSACCSSRHASKQSGLETPGHGGTRYSHSE